MHASTLESDDKLPCGFVHWCEFRYFFLTIKRFVMNADVGRIQVVIVLDPYIRVTLLELVHLSPPVVNSGMTQINVLIYKQY